MTESSFAAEADTAKAAEAAALELARAAVDQGQIRYERASDGSWPPDRKSRMFRITDEEWDRLWQDDPFETAKLLWLIDAVDWRGHGDLRTEILHLHRLAMDVFNEGRRYQVGKLFELAVALEERVRDLGERFDPVKKVLSALTDLYPESLSFEDSQGLPASS